jgi:hypothetical protein
MTVTSPDRRAQMKAWREANRDKTMASAKAWKAAHPQTRKMAKQRYPQQMAARAAVNNAVQWGRIIKPTICETCKTTACLDGHHPDYSKPLDVVWLCKPCHATIHAKDRYRD